MKKFNLLLCLLCIPVLLTGQAKYIKWSKIRYPGYPVKVKNVQVLNNEEEYQKVLKEFKDESRYRVGYGYDYRIDFIKKATKFRTDSFVYYAMHFEIEKGETLDIVADSFKLVEGAQLILSDSIGILEVYDEETEVKRIANKDHMYIGKIPKTDGEIMLTLKVPSEKVALKCKISIANIGVHVLPTQLWQKKKNSLKLHP